MKIQQKVVLTMVQGTWRAIDKTSGWCVEAPERDAAFGKLMLELGVAQDVMREFSNDPETQKWLGDYGKLMEKIWKLTEPHSPMVGTGTFTEPSQGGTIDAK